MCPRLGTWTWPQGVDPATPQRFKMSTSVTFVTLPQQPTSSTKPTPPLALPLPPEIFYPFVTSAATPAAAAAVGISLVAVAAVLLILNLVL